MIFVTLHYSCKATFSYHSGKSSAKKWCPLQTLIKASFNDRYVLHEDSTDYKSTKKKTVMVHRNNGIKLK